MAYQNQFLIRTNLLDDGSNTHLSYNSPDIISHEQVANPQDFFANNYNQDVNQMVDRGLRTNFVYIRAKNMDDPRPNNTIGYARLYRASASLFMSPEIWKNNSVHTADGRDYIDISSASQGEITVGDDVFILDGTKNDGFCLVAIIADTPDKTIPDNFTSYDDFNYWLISNHAVAIRNLNVIYNYKKYDYERLDSLTNPESQDVITAFKLTAKNLPENTICGMSCDPIGLKKEGNSHGDYTEILDAAIMPKNFNGYVLTYIKLPNQSILPDDAELSIEYWTEVTPGDKCYTYATDPVTLGITSNTIKFSPSGKLMLTGSCSTLFKNV
jgi:hypothetical protein